jgi:hypothetical protein
MDSHSKASLKSAVEKLEADYYLERITRKTFASKLKLLVNVYQPDQITIYQLIGRSHFEETKNILYDLV